MPDQNGFAIRCAGVTKSFPLYDSPAELALDRLGFGALVRRKHNGTIPAFEALRGIDLTVRHGERVGIVGRNGAGKSTLLRLISGHVSRNFKPTSGKVEVNGRIQLIAQGVGGPPPQFSGRDFARETLGANGLRGRNLDAALEDVVSFCELGEYLDQPVTTYSAGMAARLQFAVATAVQSEILIIDEMLGAGDAYFSMKSADRVRRLASSGSTLLLVSHFAQQVLQFCDRAIWIRNGVVADDGPASEVMNAYEAALEHAAHRGELSDLVVEGEDTLDDGQKVHRWPGRSGVKVRRVTLNVDGKPSTTVRTGERLAIELELEIEETSKFGCVYLVTIWTKDGHRVSRIESDVDQFSGTKGERRPISISIDNFSFGSGSYLLTLSIYDRLNFVSTKGGADRRFDVVHRSFEFNVVASDQTREFLFEHPANWSQR
jgi:lipopolysaccharide transport system ATP-binding protein